MDIPVGKVPLLRPADFTEISDCRSYHWLALRFLLRDVFYRASGAAGGNELADLRLIYGPDRRPAGGERDRCGTIHHSGGDTVVAGGGGRDRPRDGGSARNRR